MTREQIHVNLMDAGCSNSIIEQFEKLGTYDQRGEQMRLLDNHRRKLLDGIHAEQRKLDCLDYLIYTMKEVARK